MTKEQFLIAEETIFQNQLYKDNVIVVWGDFHPGVIGLISSRISEKYKKPSIVILISNTGTGSARSVNKTDFSIVKVIQDCGDYLKKYGVHRAAAGFINTNERTASSFISFSYSRSCQNINMPNPTNLLLIEFTNKQIS